MKRRIGLCLVFRDMWQSSCGCFPTVSQLKDLAPFIVSMGCFDRIEANGGAFEQVCLLRGENPNVAVRELARCFHEAGIRTQMLERGLNALRLNPVSADVRELMFMVKKQQGVDVVRSFCGLNDYRNLRLSVEYAKASGMISQVALPVVNSPVHTLDHYMDIVDKVVEYGADEICLKDMSGQGEPSFMADLTHLIRKRYPSLFIQYHSHCGPASREALLKVVRAGCDAVDVALGPLSGGASHPELMEVVDWLRSDGFLVKDVDVPSYESAVSLLDVCLSEMPTALGKDESCYEQLMNVGLPGGMMASLRDDIADYNVAVNSSLRLQALPELSREQFLVRFADEVKCIWPSLGYPSMVTPYSQYVASAALSNLLAISKGQPRWSSLSSDVWNMILGRMGRLPGAVCQELVELAASMGLEFNVGEPQELYPNVLDRCRSMMECEGWPVGRDGEELLEFAMHESQYRNYMSLLMKPVSELDDGAVYAAISMALHEYLEK